MAMTMRTRILLLFVALLLPILAEAQRIRVNGVATDVAAAPNQTLNTTSNVTFAGVTSPSLTASSEELLLNGADRTFTGGYARLKGGRNTTNNVLGAEIYAYGGEPDGHGGRIELVGAPSVNAGNAGSVVMTGGSAEASTDTNHAGGNVEVFAGLGKGTGAAQIIFNAPDPTQSPQQFTEVFRFDYLGPVFAKVYTAAPAAGDCNDAAETGRFVHNSTADRVYYCSGAAGWYLAPLVPVGALSVANVGANSCGTSAATIAGNAGSFEITVGATSGTQCRVTFPIAAPTRWNCAANNQSAAALARAMVVSTTEIDVLGVFGSGNVINVQCTPR